MARDFVLGTLLLSDQKRSGMSLSNFLEKLDPTEDYGPGEHLDAFQRCLKDLDIRTAGDLSNGVVAHNFERFYDNSDGRGDERKMLAAEWMNRTYKQAVYGTPAPQINRLFDSQAPLNFTTFPPTVLPEMRFKQIQPTALPFLLSRTRTIATESFQALYLNDAQATGEARFSRVEEWGEVPAVSFTTSVNTIKVAKFGRRLRQSYEQMRRMNMDLVSWAISYIAAQAARDKEDAAVDIIINGDGNALTPATANSGSTYDAAAGGLLTLKMWLNFRAQAFVRPYRLTTVLAAPADITNLYLLSAGNAYLPSYIQQGGTVPNAVIGTPVRTTLDGVQIVDNSSIPANKFVCIDSTAALEMVIEANADIVETDRIIQNQYQDITLTESLGFVIATLGQNQILNYTV